MNIYVIDLKKIKWLNDCLENSPNLKQLLSARPDLYFVAYYDNDYANNSLDIKHTETKYIINESIYRTLIKKSANRVAYIKEPFLSDSFFFYKILETAVRLYYLSNNINYKKNLIELFESYKNQDIKIANDKLKVIYNGTYKFNSLATFKNALNEIWFVNKNPIDGLVMIFDLFDTYYKSNFKYSFIGHKLTSIVRAVKNPNGGLLPEMANSTMRYFIIGESVAKDDPDLVLAKQLLRANIDAKTIYLKTKWYFNPFDKKWRKKISDGKYEIKNLYQSPNGEYGVPLNLTEQYKLDFYGIIYQFLIGNLKYSELLSQNYIVHLNDVFDYENCYNIYPKLKKLYTLIINSPNLKENSFYFSGGKPEHIVIANDTKKNLGFVKSVMLHEIQHYIQKVEGFSNGGNSYLGRLIASVGGSEAKKFMLGMNQLFAQNKILSESFKSDNVSFDSFKIDFLKLLSEYGIEHKLVDLVDNVKVFCDYEDEFISIFFNYIFSRFKDIPNQQYFFDFIKKWYGYKYYEFLLNVEVVTKKLTLKTGVLLNEGWTFNDIKILFFQCYETILGEIEARFTQSIAGVEQELEDYFTPYTSETVPNEKVVVLNESIIEDEGRNCVAALETYDDKYIIHLPDTYSNSVNILHELGHIMYDIVNEKYDNFYLKKIDFYKDKSIIEYAQFEEYFCDCFVDYIHRKNIEEYLTVDLDGLRKVQNLLDFDDYFQIILFYNSIQIDFVKLKKMKLYCESINDKIKL